MARSGRKCSRCFIRLWAYRYSSSRSGSLQGNRRYAFSHNKLISELLHTQTRFLMTAISSSSQRTQLRWTLIMLSTLYILALGPLVLRGGLMPTLLLFSLIGPFPCRPPVTAITVIISCVYAFVGYFCVAIIARVVSDFFIARSRRPRAAPDYANVAFDRKLASRFSLKRLRTRLQNTQRGGNGHAQQPAAASTTATEAQSQAENS